jgi:hypothetical protein
MRINPGRIKGLKVGLNELLRRIRNKEYITCRVK